MKNLIQKYFPHLSDSRQEQFIMLADLLREYNRNINVISRKDTENIEINHILHSLAIAKFIRFKPGTQVLDLGTGGGLPGIPLAILFPDVHFHLIDRIGKKINVAKEISQKLGLNNITFQHGDMGECHNKFDFVVSRAVADQQSLVKIIRKNIRKDNSNAIPNGLITLKGGDLHNELGNLNDISEVVPIANYFDEPFFETKKIVFTPII